MRQVAAKFALKFLSFDQKQHRINIVEFCPQRRKFLVILWDNSIFTQISVYILNKDKKNKLR